MDDIAADTGMGKGTLLRRFGDRASLAHGVCSVGARRSRGSRSSWIRGEPPLGPGPPLLPSA